MSLTRGPGSAGLSSRSVPRTEATPDPSKAVRTAYAPCDDSSGTPSGESREGAAAVPGGIARDRRSRSMTPKALSPSGFPPTAQPAPKVIPDDSRSGNMESDAPSVHSLTVSYIEGRRSAELDIRLGRHTALDELDRRRIVNAIKIADVLSRAYLPIIESHAAFHRGRADAFAELAQFPPELRQLAGCVEACESCGGYGNHLRRAEGARSAPSRRCLTCDHAERWHKDGGACSAHGGGRLAGGCCCGGFMPGPAAAADYIPCADCGGAGKVYVAARLVNLGGHHA